jgi:hypothetical protein
VAESFEALELLHGSAKEAFRLGLIAEELREDIGLAKQAAEALGQTVAAILGLGDLDVLDHLVMEKDEGPAIGVEDLVEAGGIDAAFDTGAEEGRLLGQGDAFDGEEFLGIGGLISGHEVGAEVVDGIEFLDADDREIGAFESVLAFAWGLCGGGFGGGDGFLEHRWPFDISSSMGATGSRGVIGVGIEAKENIDGKLLGSGRTWFPADPV